MSSRDGRHTRVTEPADNHDGLQLAWRIGPHRRIFKPVSLSGNGNILLSVLDRSVLRLHTTSTLKRQPQANVTSWCFVDDSSRDTRVGSVPALALDYKGQTAAIAYWSKRRSKSRYLLTIKVFSCHSLVTLLSSRTIWDARSLDSFSLSPGGLSWAVTYTLRSSNLKRNEVARMCSMNETPRYALVGASRAGLYLHPKTDVHCSDSGVMVITPNPLMIRKFSLHELEGRGRRSSKALVDGIDFILADQYRILAPFSFELSGRLASMQYTDYLSRTGYLVLTYSGTIFVWDTIRS